MMKMTGKDDVIVGTITNYSFDQIKPWVNSLDSCGFEGKKVVIVYNIDKNVVDELTKRDYTVFAFHQDENGNYRYKDNFSIVVERFFHIWAMMKGLKGKHRYLLHTDVKDVIFQKNPSEFMDTYLRPKDSLGNSNGTIMAASESITYENEAWGRQNMIDSFGQVLYEVMKNERIVNAGTLSGHFDDLIDFFLNVYMVSVGGKTHNPDQAAVNILLSQETYKNKAIITIPVDAWACQAGTTNDPNKDYSMFHIEYGAGGSNIRDYDDIICNFNKEPFYIVHQYDRVPQWKEIIMRKYG